MANICEEPSKTNKDSIHNLHQLLASGFDPERLLSLAQADQNGFTQIFPCKVHDVVWFVKKTNGRPELIKTHVEKLIVKGTGVYLKLACNAMYETSAKSIGKTVFFDELAAKAAIQI